MCFICLSSLETLADTSSPELNMTAKNEFSPRLFRDWRKPFSTTDYDVIHEIFTNVVYYFEDISFTCYVEIFHRKRTFNVIFSLYF